ncbi:MAG TPA: hypothetical protein VF435_13445, partial [Pyrinomonadaceae bacterium]
EVAPGVRQEIAPDSEPGYVTEVRIDSIGKGGILVGVEIEPIGEEGDVIGVDVGRISDSEKQTRRKARDADTTRSKSVIESEPAFYFALEGERVKGNVVEFGADVDLVFDYGAFTDKAIGTVTGTPIDKARETDSEFGISVIPIGFKFRKTDKRWYKVARFRDGKLLEQVRFLLQAPKQATTESDTGFQVTFYFLGHAQYSFSIPTRLVRSLRETKATLPPAQRIEIDLDKHIKAAMFGEELLDRPLERSLLNE